MAIPDKQETRVSGIKDESLYCNVCRGDTQHSILAETKLIWNDKHGYTWMYYQIVQCKGCMTISFSKKVSCSEWWDIDEETGEEIYGIERTRYPEEIDCHSEIGFLYHLPNDVRKIYEQTLVSYKSKLFIMVGFGIRAIVEAVCNDKSIKGRKLEEKIDGLADGGYITKSGAAILHSLRFMGNESVHEMKEHSAKELDAAFGVVQYLLQGVYIIPKTAENLPKK